MKNTAETPKAVNYETGFVISDIVLTIADYSEKARTDPEYQKQIAWEVMILKYTEGSLWLELVDWNIPLSDNEMRDLLGATLFIDE